MVLRALSRSENLFLIPMAGGTSSISCCRAICWPRRPRPSPLWGRGPPGGPHCLLPCRRLETIADSDPSLGPPATRISVRVVLHPGYTRARTHHLREEGGSFLIEMEQRLSAKTAEAVALPMSCYNIADYLGLSVETVSRALTGLKHRGRDQGLSRASFALSIAVRWSSASQTETSGMVAWHTGNVR
jgi:hypothetical protein